MDTLLRIRESSPCEILADRLEREAQLAPAASEQAASYRYQAQMLREMAAIPKIPAHNLFSDSLFANF